MKSTVEWWRMTAIHMWRTYFAMEQTGHTQPDSPSDQLIYKICDKIFTENFVKTDQDIIRMYFTSRWGDDIYAVEDYHLKHGVPVKVIWIVIKRACRLAMEEIGLMDRREENDVTAHD